jgi:hypothetical protein
MWAERWRELEEIENARRKELDKQMHDAKLKLEMAMHRAKSEHEILVKRREIEQQQAELRQKKCMVLVPGPYKEIRIAEVTMTMLSCIIVNNLKIQVLVIPSHKIHCMKVQAITIFIRKTTKYDERSSQRPANATAGVYEFLW